MNNKPLSGLNKTNKVKTIKQIKKEHINKFSLALTLL